MWKEKKIVVLDRACKHVKCHVLCIYNWVNFGFQHETNEKKKCRNEVEKMRTMFVPRITKQWQTKFKYRNFCRYFDLLTVFFMAGGKKFSAWKCPHSKTTNTVHTLSQPHTIFVVCLPFIVNIVTYLDQKRKVFFLCRK